jgi:hypothetical protein
MWHGVGWNIGLEIALTHDHLASPQVHFHQEPQGRIDLDRSGAAEDLRAR